MTLRNLAVLGLFATACWWGTSCAAGGSDNSCGNGYCEVDETSMTCPADCGGGSCGNTVCEPGETTASCTSDCYCGNGTCDGGESELTCTLDCLCGDGVCSASESTTTCTSDCYCGNNTCDAGESLADCPGDCAGNPVCGDGTCNGTESAASCPADCAGTCGDGTCDADESPANCPADCGAACTDPVCDLYPQCGCTGGQKCSLQSSTKTCMAAGSTSVGGTCTAEGDCVAGSMCLGRDNAGTQGQCLGYCDPVTQAGCTASTSYCLELVDPNQITIPGAGVCTVTCQPHKAPASCPSGFSCEIYTHNITQVTFSDCHADVGSGTYGAACDLTTGPYCSVGYGCFNDGTSNACYQWCVMGSSCSTGTCNTAVFDPPITLGGLTYGVCLI